MEQPAIGLFAALLTRDRDAVTRCSNAPVTSVLGLAGEAGQVTTLRLELRTNTERVAAGPQAVWWHYHRERRALRGSKAVFRESRRGFAGARFAKLTDVDDRVAVRVLTLALTMAIGASCADAPTSPTRPAAPSLPPAVNLAGTWRGQYVEVACISTTCPVCCTSRGKIERRRDLTLVMTQDGAVVTGVWTEAPIQTQGTLAGSFSGTVSGTSLTLAGALFPARAPGAPPPQEPPPYRLTDFSAATAGPSGPLTGTFHIVTIDATGRETQRLRNDLAGLARVP